MTGSGFASRFGDVLDRSWNALLRVRVISLVALVLVAVLVVTVASLGDDGGDVRAGSEVLGDPPGEPVAVPSTPRAYRIVYRIENRAAGDLVVETEEVTVRRPFDGRVVDRAGEPPGGRRQSVTVTRFGFFGTDSPRAEPTVLHVPPNPPAGDADPVDALNAAVGLDRAELRERRRIEAVDRRCQVYRIGGPIAGGALTPIGAVEGEHTDVCIDSSGLVLEEVNVVDDDRVLRRRVAVDVDESPDLGEEAFSGPDAEVAPADEGGGSVLEVEPTSRPPADPFFELPSAPGGFEHRGRYAVIPPQAEAFADPVQRNARVAGVSDVYVGGPDLVVIDQGGTLGRVDAFENHPFGRPVDVGALGTGELLLGARISEVRVARDGGRYVRVYGTVAPELLLDVIRSLEPRDGGELVYLDPPPP